MVGNDNVDNVNGSRQGQQIRALAWKMEAFMMLLLTFEA
jgi:hypothetical protein